MKKLLIIYPNWIPSNAVGVLRVRLIVNYLNEFGWEPIILCVNSQFYEEEISTDLTKLVKPGIKVEYVSAEKANKKIRLYGDITLRAFRPLKKRAVELIKEYEIDCVWIPIPPFYTALIGRYVNKKTGVPYGIDYIDPWVHEFPGGKTVFSRAKLSSLLAKFLEPIAIKKASFFTGVSAGYYLPVFKRNPELKNILHNFMPYGFDPNDYTVKPGNEELLWSDTPTTKAYVYAGAFLPQSHYFIEIFFRIIASMKQNKILDPLIHFYFIGTGFSNLNSIADYAAKYDITDIVTEKGRIPYLEVLNNLSNAAGVLAIGSTEFHYTASKIFQSVISEKPVFAVFHHESTVVQILREAKADNYLLKYDPAMPAAQFENMFYEKTDEYLNIKKGWSPDIDKLYPYSAKYSAKVLADILNETLNKKQCNK